MRRTPFIHLPLLLVWLCSRSASAAPAAPGRGFWLSLTGFVSGAQAGVVAALGIPLHAVVAGNPGPPRTQLGEPPTPQVLAYGGSRRAALLVTPLVARKAVDAAWKTAGVSDEGRLDGLASRARISAVLPELRLRVMQTGADTLFPTDVGYVRTSSSSADKFWLEARAIFHLGKLIFADEEVSVEHMRQEMLLERQRVAARTLECLSRWQRASSELDTAVDAAAQLDASLRMMEAETSLDVLTGGWFTSFLASVRGQASSRE